MASKAEKEEKTEKFIEEWKKLRCLWDVLSVEYRDRNEKRKGYEKLSNFCEMTEDEVKAKINSLRAYYNKELCKIRQSKKSGAGGDIYVSKWPHFRSMEFIRDTVKPRKSTSTLDSIDGDIKDSDEEDTAENPLPEDDYPNVDDSESQLNQPKSTKRPLMKRKRENERGLSKAEIVMDEAISFLKDTTSQPPIDDAEIFGKNIACGLRKVKDERSKEFAKVKIQEILFQAQFGLLACNHYQPIQPIMSNVHQNINSPPPQRPFLQSPTSSMYSDNQMDNSPFPSPNF